MADDWQTNSGFAETNLHMLQQEILCDVTFVVGENKQEVKAHKYMLVSRSPVFYAMFCGPMAESKDVVEVPDMEIDGFQQLLRFLYTEQCDITANTVMFLLYASKKYQMDAMVTICKSYLETEISTENVCMILQHGYTYDEQDLVQKCLSCVYKNGDLVLESEGFLSLSRDVLSLIVESDLLQTNEEKVYTSCIKWAKEACKRSNKDVSDLTIREVLGNVIFLIRFTLMTIERFTTLVSDSEILTSEEKINIYQQFSSTDKERKYLFSLQTRKQMKIAINININRFDESNFMFTGWYNDEECRPAIEFECSNTMQLAGVSLFNPCREGEAKGKLVVLDGKKVLMCVNVKLTFNGSNHYTDVLFGQPIDIEKNKRYTLRETLTGTPLVYGQRGNAVIEEKGVKVTFFKSKSDRGGSSPVLGQFFGLIFKSWE